MSKFLEGSAFHDIEKLNSKFNLVKSALGEYSLLTGNLESDITGAPNTITWQGHVTDYMVAIHDVLIKIKEEME